jgi:DNA primase catalytic core, N-terminal domain/Toprim domain
VPERDGAQNSGRLLISQLIRLAHLSQNKKGAAFSDKGGNQVTRCPMPDHQDENPSCDFDNDRGRTGHFNCRSCGESGFGDELAERLFPDKSYFNLLAEVQALDGFETASNAFSNTPRTPPGMQPGVNQRMSSEIKRSVSSRQRNHRQALSHGSDANAIEQRRRDLLSVNEAAGRWYEAQLKSAASLVTSAEPETFGKTYFRRRGIDDDTHAEFRLGYAPPNTDDALYRHLHEKNFASALFIQADIFRSSKNNPDNKYSPFRGRAILPMQNEEGQIIGFGGRLTDTDQLLSSKRSVIKNSRNISNINTVNKNHSPKYMHSANIWIVENKTSLFKKGDWFFNIHRAKSAVKASRRLLIVEGYLDVVGLHQSGIREVISPIGVTLSETQLRRAWELVDTPIICLDGDDAGRRAAGRIAAKAYAMLDPKAAELLSTKVTDTLADNPAKVLSSEQRAKLAEEAAGLWGRKSLSFALLDGGKDPFDVVRDGMDNILRTVVADLRPLSNQELSINMRQGGAKAFEAKLSNLIDLETMVVEKLERDAHDAFSRESRKPDAPGSKRKRDDELELRGTKRQKANVPKAEAVLKAYLAKKNLIRHQIIYPVVAWEAKSPYAPLVEPGDEIWRISIFDLRKNLKLALATLHREESGLLFSLAEKMSDQTIEHLSSATAALNIHDRGQSPEWRTDLPIGSLPPPRAPCSNVKRAADKGEHSGGDCVTSGYEAVGLRARNYALVNRDLLRFELSACASAELALSNLPTMIRSMTDVSDRCRTGIRRIFADRLALHRKELPLVERSGRETVTVSETPPVPSERLDHRNRNECRV